MKRVLSIVSVMMVLCILLSCTAVTVYAEGESMDPEELGITSYYSTGNQLIVPGLPKLIRGTLEYDDSKAEIYREHPDYGEEGVRFPLSERYGQLYDVAYHFEGTVLYFEYTVKNGVTLDDYLDALDALESEDRKVSREPGKIHNFLLVDLALKLKEFSMIGVAWTIVTDVILDDGTVLYENGSRTGDGYGYQGGLLFPLALPSQEQTGATPTEAPIDPYRDKLKRRYGITDRALIDYELLYEHKDANGEVDWALIKGAESGAVSGKWSEPAYYEFGNRVMTVDYAKRPFAFGMGVYIAKYDRFFDVNAPEFRELDDLERVWTQMGAGRLMGDMDGNNCLEIIDAVMIQRCQAEMTDYPTEDYNYPPEWEEGAIKYFSDFDQDGVRNITDATAIQRFLANLSYRSEAKPAPTEPAPTQPEPTEPEVLDTPQITGFKSTAEGVEITIGAVPGAEKYRVYYKNKNGNWVKMGETETGVFVDKDVKTGTTYRYTVRCIKADLSEFTSDCNTEGWSYRYYPTPKITKCEAVADGVQITWDSVKGAAKYRVYYNGSKGWTKMADVTGTSCVDTDVTAKHWYTYTVRCVSSDGQSFTSDYDPNGAKFYLAETPIIDYFSTRMDGINIEVWASKAIARIYRKTSNGWKRIAEIDTQDDCVFRDTDVEPGKTYTYTVRIVDENGVFLSYYNTSGWSYTYKKADCLPELEIFMYDGDDMVLVQPKADNKFGIKYFDVNIRFNSETVGNVKVTDEPTYIRSEYFKPDHDYYIEITGTDASGNAVTKTGDCMPHTMIAPTNLRAERTGDRQYRFSWDIYYGYPDWYSFGLISTDGKYSIDPGDLTERHFDVDLSAYPQDTEWFAFVSVVKSDGVSVSWPDRIDFKESDYP